MTVLYCPNGHGAATGQFCAQCGAALTAAHALSGDALRIRSPEAHASVNPTFIMPGAAMGEGPALLLKCPRCGHRNREADVFDCQGPCGRVNLCRRHFDEEYDLCKDCAVVARGDLARETARQAQLQVDLAEWRGRAGTADAALAAAKTESQRTAETLDGVQARLHQAQAGAASAAAEWKEKRAALEGFLAEWRGRAETADAALAAAKAEHQRTAEALNGARAHLYQAQAEAASAAAEWKEKRAALEGSLAEWRGRAEKAEARLADIQRQEEVEAARQAGLKRQQEAAERERQMREAEVARQAGLKRQPEAAEHERQVREAEAARQAGLKRQQEAVRRGPIEFDWVDIPAGPFLMGSDKAKDSGARDDELPQHTVTLGAYRIARVPVTNAQYKAFVDATGYRAPGRWSNGGIPEGKENHPVVEVSWQDAQAFCKWAGVRLPSEAEWEKAARGTDGRIYPWGNEAPDKDRCNFKNNVKDTTPVGRYEKGMSPYGVLDLAGNVWEWVSSKDRNYPYQSNDGRENQNRTDVRRVLRGGSWLDGARYVRSAYRSRLVPGYRDGDFGFRVASPGL